MKRIIALLLAALLLPSLAACGAAPDSGGQAPAPDASAPDAPAADAGTDGEAEITLVVWTDAELFDPVDPTGLRTPDELPHNVYIRKFEESHPGVKVELLTTAYGDMNEMFKAANISGEGPDLIALWAGESTNEFSDYLLPLQDYLTQEEIQNYAGIELCYEDSDTDKNLCGLPVSVTTLQVFYNKAHFQQAGIDRTPETWEEFLAACEKLDQAGIRPLVTGDSKGHISTWVTCDWLVDLVGKDGIPAIHSGELRFDGGEFQQMLTQWQDFFREYPQYVNPDAASVHYLDGALPRFFSGEYAMTIGGSWDNGTMYETMGDNVGTFVIPAITADAPYGDAICSQCGTNFCVTSYTKHPDLAVEFLRYITSAEFQSAWAEYTGEIPSNCLADVSGVENPLLKQEYEWVSSRECGIGWDCLVSVECAGEWYRDASALTALRMSPQDVIDKLTPLQ